MKRKARWLVALLVVGGIVAGSLVPGLAAEPDTLRRLAVENRVAEVLANLKLTADQKEQLKEVALSYRSAQSALRAELAELLANRRDALLDNDREALTRIDAALEALRSREPLTSDESTAEFVAGLTERQRLLLAQILPGVGRRDVRVHVRERMNELKEHLRALPGRMEIWRMDGDPLPGFPPERAWESARLHVWLGPDLEVVDVLIDLLDR